MNTFIPVLGHPIVLRYKMRSTTIMVQRRTKMGRGEDKRR